MQRQITRGASAGAGLIFHIFAQDSASTTGAGKASIAFGSWTCRYIRNGEAISGAITPEDIATIGTYAAPTANTNIRIKAVDNTNMIGIYEVQIHADWVNTTNTCQSLTIYLTATGVAVLPIQIPLSGFNLQDTVRGGLTALPNAAAEAAGGLFTRGTGAGQINQDANGRIDVNIAAISTDATAADNFESYTDGTTQMPVNVTQISGDATAADNLEAALDGTGGVTVTAALTGNITGNLSGSVGSVTGNVGGNVAGSVGSVTAEVTPTAASKTGYRLSATGVGDILTTALTEAYAADGAAPTLTQALYGILQFLTERAIVTTTLTVNKLDGTTAAMTFTLNDATNPTSITRAT